MESLLYVLLSLVLYFQPIKSLTPLFNPPGQLESEGRVMSNVPARGVDLCDNLPNPETLTAQTQNLNETNSSLPPSQNEEGGGCRLTQKTHSNNGNEEEEEQGQKEDMGRGREEDEEEDTDEMMKEEEESEELSGLIRCQSPDTPMTDSSYSETGKTQTYLYTERKLETTVVMVYVHVIKNIY